jgi:outer membrane protein, adhesin transport system
MRQLTGASGRTGVAIAALIVMAGCFGGNDPEVTRAADGSAPAVLDATMQDGSESVLIADLLNRRSVLEPGALQTVAQGVLDANTRAAEADLRAARLRAEAQQSNWLPAIGPAITLDALGAVAATVMISQVIFDNGAARADREYARADVEVAAVGLSEDSNLRVEEGLSLYLTAEAARARAEVNRAAMETMGHYAYVMTERVNAGISDRADLQLVIQRQDQMRSDMQSDLEEVASSLAELQAMAAIPVDTITGLSPVSAVSPTASALTVMRAEAEGSRAVAQAESTRAGFLPGVSVGGDIVNGGEDLGLTVAVPNGLTLGTGAALQAVDAEKAAAAARIGQERENAARTLAALQGQLTSLIRQAEEAQSLARDAAANYALFEEQQRAGQRDVPEVVGVFETKVRSARTASDLRYDIVRMQVRIAGILGALVDGERI